MSAWMPTEGSYTYFGYTFTGPVEARYQARFVYDQAGRTVVAVKYNLRISTLVQPDDLQGETPTDAEIETGMQNLRRRLSRPGQRLTIAGTGFGDLDINAPGGKVRDVMWGPKPDVLTLDPVGSVRVWRLDWSVEFALPECSDARYIRDAMAFNFTTDYSHDERGLQTRTIAGYVEIPMTRWLGGKRVVDNVDRLTKDVAPRVPDGFNRVGKRRQVSMDKRRLDFSFTDRQIPNSHGFPPGIIRADGRHRLQAENSAINEGGHARWTGVISASYVLAQGARKRVATDAFLRLMDDRIFKALERVRGATALVTGLDAEEGLYLSDQEVSLSCQYWFLADLRSGLIDGGLWRPLPDVDWRRWANDRTVREFLGPYGWAGLVEGVGVDAIVDLCGGDESQRAALRSPTPKGLEPRRRLATTGMIDPRTNWLHYDGELTVKVTTNVMRHKLVGAVLKADPAGPNMPGILGGVNALNPGVGLAGKPAGKLINKPAKPTPDVVQRRATPTYTAILSGRAIRAGMRVPIPKLVTLGGVEVVPDKQVATEKKLATLAGVGIYGLSWSLSYLVPGEPADALIPVHPNPAVEGA